MRTKVLLLIIQCFSFTLVVAHLNYADSIKAIANNRIQPNDDSQGTVWFNTTGYSLEEYGFPMIDDYGIHTYSSFNYLKKVLGLANIALENGIHGDYVFLLYKFLYGGQHEPTSINPSSDMVKDMIKDLNPKFNRRHGSDKLLEILNNTASIPELQDLYNLVADATLIHAFEDWDNE
ncbi:uncharacterized protein RJT21DRAFT_40411 [Scheffersomyces amazonensis]|uniref:uncharacterized protein n=1 Tax=Scheffersomyces amazonensis TaxID=1078765 RepID=UPI00315D1676